MYFVMYIHTYIHNMYICMYLKVSKVEKVDFLQMLLLDFVFLAHLHLYVEFLFLLSLVRRL